MVKDIYAGSRSGLPSYFHVDSTGNTMFFGASGGSARYELYKTDGTAAGTKLVKDIYPGLGSSRPMYFVNYGGKTYFSAGAGDAIGRELWQTDGTAAGTALVKDIRPGGLGSEPSFMAPVPGGFIFAPPHGMRRLQDALGLLDIRVLDHIVIGDAETVSLAERGLM